MEKLVFVFLLFVNFLQAQKIEVGFMMVPQITSSDFKAPTQTNPLHAGLWYHFNENIFLILAYTAQSENIFSGLVYKNYYLVQSLNINNNSNYSGLGIVFPISRFNPATLFFEIGTSYSFKEKNNLPVILSTGIFIPFKKEI